MEPEEAERAVLEGKRVYGIYDPLFESFQIHGDRRDSARIVTTYDGKLDKPAGHKNLTSIVFYLEEINS